MFGSVAMFNYKVKNLVRLTTEGGVRSKGEEESWNTHDTAQVNGYNPMMQAFIFTC